MLEKPCFPWKSGKGVHIINFVFGVIIQKKYIKNGPHTGDEYSVSELLHPADRAILSDYPIIYEIQFASAAGNLLADIPLYPVPVIWMNQVGKSPSSQLHEILKRGTPHHGNKPGVSIKNLFPFVITVNQDTARQMFRHLLKNQMLNLFLKYSANLGANGKVNIAIVGGGATGVELSAELHNAVKQLHSYGYKGLTNDALNVTLVEAGERILPALPPRISGAAHNELTKLGVRVLTQTMVTSADEGGLHTKDGEYIKADLMVWAAGIKAPDFMKDIGGLETNRINQLVVEPTLQSTRDPDVYAIGDCASCARPEGGFVPPRAQAAHQMATCAMNNILAQINGKPLKNYQYKDHGSLVSLSNFSTVGSLMGNLTRGSMMIEGRIARFVYISLYRMHQIALHGYFKTGLMMLVGSINRVIRPRLKLH